jgi:hypothetical protein
MYLFLCAILNNEHVHILNTVDTAALFGSLGILQPMEVDPRPWFELIKVMGWGVWHQSIYVW